MSIFTDNIEAILKAKGIQRKDFFAGIGVSSVTYYNWKKGSFEPQMDKVYRAADFLGVPVSDLLTQKKTAALSGDGALPREKPCIINRCRVFRVFSTLCRASRL